MREGLKKFLSVVAILLVFSMGGFSSHIMMDGDMMPCPYAGMASLCTMTPLEHISGWLSLFSVPVQDFVILLLLSVIFLPFGLFFAGYLLKLRHYFLKISTQYRGVEKVFNSLQLAFAQGIIHSKAY